MSVLVLVLSGTAFAYYEHLNGNVHRVPVFSKIVGGRPSAALDGALNILVIGDDSRDGATPAELAAEHTTGDGGGTNTDTIIILHLAPNNGPATLISIPRDSYVPIPGHGTFKINSAYEDGELQQKGDGPALLTQTVENLTGLHFDHFISVSFGQFINISNAIGGVKVCVENPNLTARTVIDSQGDHTPAAYVGGAYDKQYSGLTLTPGVHSISGSDALAFVRQRHNLPGGDLDRIHRQQRFLTAVKQKALNTTNPLTINAVLEQATKSLTVDSGLTGTDLVSLANRLRNLKPADIHFATVPVANAAATSPSGVSYVQLDMTRLKTFFDNLQAERDPNAAAPASTAPAGPSAATVSPSSVTVTVQNGSGVSGAAGRTQTALAGYGFQVPSIGNASQTSTTKILYASADAAAAAELARAVPSAVLESDSGLAAGTVELVLGSNFAGTQSPGTTAASATPAPSPTSSGTVPGSTSVSALLAGPTMDGVPCGP